MGYERKYDNFTVFVDIEMTARYWGEEREPDAIYAVYLRKVRYRAPNLLGGVTHFRYFDPEKQDGAADHLQWETVKERVVKAANLKKLVSCLVGVDGEVDTRHFNVFFATYRAFAKPFDVLRLILVELYSVLNNDRKWTKERQELLLRSWRNVLLCWLDLYGDDFRDHPKYACLTQLIEFTRTYQSHLQDVFVKAVRRRDKFCRDLSGIRRRPSLERCSLLSPLDGVDYLFSPKANKSPDVSTIDPVYVAEQLTYWDAELFKRLVPHQCQSCFWSRRNKAPDLAESVYTVKATIEQFNAVSRRVMASVVSQPNVKPSCRARIVANWIDIAQELRLLKNFSSLKAVLSGLQSEPVYRLRNVWALVPSEKVKEFNELSRIFSEDDNYNGARAVLEQEGTAKAAVNVAQSSKDKHQKRLYRHRRTKSEMGEIQGTVPYLGTFLTDLTMIDTAYSDFTAEGLINFEKRRREFDVIAQLKLFQSSARNYHIDVDMKFRTWFAHLSNLSEQHCYQLSCLIEPPVHSNGNHIQTKSKNSKALAGTLTRFFFREHLNADEPDEFYFYANSNGKSESQLIRGGVTTASTPVLPVMNGNSVFYDSMQFSADELLSYRNKRRSYSGNGDDSVVAGNGSLSNGHAAELNDSTSRSSYTDGVSALNSSHNTSVGSSGENGYNSPPMVIYPPSKVNGSRASTEDDFYVVRVKLERCLQSDITMTTMYKCVKLENSDRTYSLIEKALQKHQLNGEPSDYWIVQILANEDELILPDKGNAFYAVVPQLEMNFELRRKTSQTPTTLRIKKNKRKKNSRSSTNLLRWSSGFL